MNALKCGKLTSETKQMTKNPSYYQKSVCYRNFVSFLFAVFLLLLSDIRRTIFIRRKHNGKFIEIEIVSERQWE